MTDQSSYSVTLLDMHGVLDDIVSEINTKLPQMKICM
jgi:hypothetical protein